MARKYIHTFTTPTGRFRRRSAPGRLETSERHPPKTRLPLESHKQQILHSAHDAKGPDNTLSVRKDQKRDRFHDLMSEQPGVLSQDMADDTHPERKGTKQPWRTGCKEDPHLVDIDRQYTFGANGDETSLVAGAPTGDHHDELASGEPDHFKEPSSDGSELENEVYVQPLPTGSREDLMLNEIDHQHSVVHEANVLPLTSNRKQPSVRGSATNRRRRAGRDYAYHPYPGWRAQVAGLSSPATTRHMAQVRNVILQDPLPLRTSSGLRSRRRALPRNGPSPGMQGASRNPQGHARLDAPIAANINAQKLHRFSGNTNINNERLTEFTPASMNNPNIREPISKTCQRSTPSQRAQRKPESPSIPLNPALEATNLDRHPSSKRTTIASLINETNSATNSASPVDPFRELRDVFSKPRIKHGLEKAPPSESIEHAFGAKAILIDIGLPVTPPRTRQLPTPMTTPLARVSRLDAVESYRANETSRAGSIETGPSPKPVTGINGPKESNVAAKTPHRSIAGIPSTITATGPVTRASGMDSLPEPAYIPNPPFSINNNQVSINSLPPLHNSQQKRKRLETDVADRPAKRRIRTDVFEMIRTNNTRRPSRQHLPASVIARVPQSIQGKGTFIRSTDPDNFLIGRNKQLRIHLLYDDAAWPIGVEVEPNLTTDDVDQMVDLAPIKVKSTVTGGSLTVEVEHVMKRKISC
jgi:hypothetical protein